eukprot:TRINITY_DN2778_c0_g1_i1.p1 TRINITY_DN2778_c0_g1~~TRINITY_DN2778_c0_g1_i1.p1  ORF type:complete len:914 (+),score=132.91 TRINITY_DN2778_c0_g1_i1:82-2823(+)
MERSDKSKNSNINIKSDNNANKSQNSQSYASPMEKLKANLQLVIDSSLNSMPDEDSASSDSSRDRKTQLDAMSKVYSRFASDHHLPASAASSSKSYAEDDEHYKKAKHWMRSRSFDISSRNLLQKYQFAQPEPDAEESSQESSKLASIKEDEANKDEDSMSGISEDSLSWQDMLAVDPKKIRFDKTTKTSPRSPRSVSVMIKPTPASTHTTMKHSKSLQNDTTDRAPLRSTRSNEFHGFSRARTSSTSEGSLSESISSTSNDHSPRPRSKSIAVGTLVTPRLALTQKKSEPNLLVKGPLVTVQEKERKLKRSDSEPYLYSWEYGNIEADLYIPKIGSINIYLAQLWRKKDNVLYQRVKERKLRPSVSSRFGLKIGNEEFSLRSSTESSAEEDVVFKDEQNRTVLSATRSKLLQLLIDSQIADSDFIETILSSHILWTTSADVLGSLLKFFDEPFNYYVPENPSKLSEAEKLKAKNIIQFRVIIVLKKWLKMSHHDIARSQTLTHQFIGFIERLSKDDSSKAMAEIMSVAWDEAGKKANKIHANVYDYENHSSIANLYSPVMPRQSDYKKWNFVELSMKELSRQLTVCYHMLTLRVTRDDLFNAIKTKPDVNNPVVILSSFSKRVTNWVKSEVLLTPNIKKQQSIVLNKLVQLLLKLLDLNNFHGAMDIFLGLQDLHIEALKKTWSNVDKANREKYNMVVQELFNPRLNWSNLRARIQGADTPLITPFNLILHDLAMMSEHDTYQDQQEKFINYEKMKSLADILRNFERSQHDLYPFQPILSYQSWFKEGLVSLDDAQITTEIVKRTGETSPRGPAAALQRISSRKSLTLIFKRKKSSNKMSADKKISGSNVLISPTSSSKEKEPTSAPLQASSLGTTPKVGSASAPGSANVPRKTSPLSFSTSPTIEKHSDKK